MLKRVITGAIFAVVLISGVLLQGWFLRILLLFAMLMSISEMYRAFRKNGSDPVRWAGYLFCFIAAGAQALSATMPHPVFHAISPAVLALTVSLLAAMCRIISKGKVAFDSMVMSVFPILYPGLLFTLILSLQDLNCRFISTLALALAFFMASVNDVFALLIGVKFGKHRLSPEISPKKSIEGSIAGLIASILFAVALPAAFNAAAAMYPNLNPTGAVLPPPQLYG